MLSCAVLGALLSDWAWLRTAPSPSSRDAKTASNVRTIRGGDGGGDGDDNGDDNNVDDLSGLDDDYDYHPSSSSSSSSTSWDSRIRYRLVRGRPYEQLYGKYYTCSPEPPNGRPLPDEVQGPGILDFQTDITTSLKIAIVGDSIGVQIGHRLEEAMQPRPQEDGASAAADSYRRYAYVETGWNNLVASYPVRGGGALLSYRVNGMLWDDMQTFRRHRRHRRQRRLRSSSDPLSRRQPHHRHLQAMFKPQTFNRSELDVALSRPMIPLRQMDVLVQRITFPWVHLEDITMERLVNNTLLASELFGMETMVYVNFHFSNNVVDQPNYDDFLGRQQLVRNFTRTFVPPTNSSLQRILLLDFDRLVDQLNEVNARRIGLDTANEPFDQWMLSQTLGPYIPGMRYRQHIAQMCGELVPNHTQTCPGNMIFIDGLHICPSTFAGRITAGISCLIDCAERDRDQGRRQHHHHDHHARASNSGGPPPPAPATHGPDSPLRMCERACNDKYMTLSPIPAADMVEWEGS